MNDTSILMTRDIVMSNELVAKITVAIVILIIGIILGRITAKILQKILNDLNLDSVVKKRTGFKPSIANLIVVFSEATIYVIFSIIALNYVGVTSLILNVLFIAIIFVLSISFMLALKDFLPNVFAGLKLAKNKDMKEGKKIIISGIEGTIKEISLTEIKIEKSNKDDIHIPNALFLKEFYITKK